MKGMEDILAAASKKSAEELKGHEIEKKEVDLIGEDNSGVHYVEWRRSRRIRNWRNKDIADWNDQDLVSYMLRSYQNVVGEPWAIGHGIAFEYMKKSQEGLKRALSEWPSARLTKLYFDWFFAERAERLIAMYGCISINMLQHPESISSFHQFLHERNIGVKTHVVSDKKADTDSHGVSMHNLTTDVRSFLLRHGIFNAYLCLRKQANMTDLGSQQWLKEPVKKLVADGCLNELYQATENSGPFETDMQDEFKSLQRALTEATQETFLLLNVEFR